MLAAYISRVRKNIHNESTEVQTLGAIRIQLYHQCFEEVWQHNFTSIIVFEGRHNAIGLHMIEFHRPPDSERTEFGSATRQHVRHNAIDLRRSAHRSSIFESRHIDLRRSTHQSSIFEGRHIDFEGGNIAPTTQHRADNSSPNIVHHGAQ